MALKNPCRRRYQGRRHRGLKGAGGDNQTPRDEPAGGGFDGKSRRPDARLGAAHLNPGTDRHVDHLGIVDQIARDPVLWREALRVEPGEGKIGKAVMPGRTVGDQGIPTPGAPRLGNPMFFKDQMRHAMAGEMFARRDADLAAADDQGVDIRQRHMPAPRRRGVPAAHPLATGGEGRAAPVGAVEGCQIG